jgi:hypothetical protein
MISLLDTGILTVTRPLSSIMRELLLLAILVPIGDGDSGHPFRPLD